jgi:hypothetical protein
MRAFIVIMIFIFEITPAFSGEAFFRPESRKKIAIKEGDSFKGVIELWSIDNISSEMVSKLEGSIFLDHFYVVSLGKPAWSENNPQVVVISGSFILQKSLESNSLLWKLGGLKIPVSIKEIKTSVLSEKRKEFIILDGKYNAENDEPFKYYYIALFVFLSLVFCFYFYKNRKTPKVNQKNKEVNWKELLVNAKEKEDFSHIYLSKNKWISKVQNKDVATRDFLNCASAYLFKPDLEDHELEELRISIDSVVKGMVD